MTADDLATLNEQIAAMARAGLPMDVGLQSLARDMGRGKLRRVTEGLAEDLRRGSSLDEAVGARSAELPPYYASLIRAGIRTGHLPDVLLTLTNYARSVATTKSIIAEAVIYPIIVIVLSLALLIFATIFVLPQFEEMYRSFRMQLPLATEAVLWLGRDPIKKVVAPILSVFLISFLVWFILRQSASGRRTWTHTLYSIPLIGTMLRTSRLAAFVELLAVMVDHKVPVPEAIQLAGDASSDEEIAEQAQTIRLRLESGDGLAAALRGRGMLPEWVAWMALAGESRGTLAETLREIGRVYRRQVESRAAVLRNTLPSMLILMTATVVISLFTFVVIVPAIKLIQGLAM